MQDALGQPLIEVPMAQVPPGLRGAEATAWHQAVATLGLAAENFDGQFVFIHQQWLAFFAALGCGSQRPLPDLAPPPLHPPPGQALLQHLAIDGNRLDLPPVTPHHERIRFAAALSASPEAWLRRLLPLNLALAAQVALDHRNSLEPGADGCWPGEGRPGPHPVLQHIRRLLLLRSVDAGASVRAGLHAAGVLGPDAASAALAQHMPGFDAALQAHWQQAWQAACQGEGVDLRDRLQAGLLLGELGDNLRYEWVSVAQPDGSLRIGLRPKASQWASLGHFEIAKAPVTVAEWAWFMAGGGYDDAAAAWWQQAGPAAQRWLRQRRDKGERTAPRAWGRADQSNPLQAVSGISAHEALAYAAWAQGLYPGLPAWRLQVPSEPMWEAGVGGVRPGKAGPIRALDFNHQATRYWRPSPVGVFSRSHTALGLADTAGNVCEWCVNAPDSLERQALRGGGCVNTADRCRPAYRDHRPPGGDDDYIGLRLVRCVLPHSEP